VCGFAGFFGGPRGWALEEAVARMSDRLAHRGPDDRGQWVDPEAGIALGHRRLAILDLSPAGHQPMASASGRYVIAFNGEIYNHLVLRRELGAEMAAAVTGSERMAGGKATADPVSCVEAAPGGGGRLSPGSPLTPARLPAGERGFGGSVAGGLDWRGHSDTETLLAAFERWGVEETLRRAVGMFAVALWDRAERRLHLARDRLGEKPLYYGWCRGAFVFGSELKALRASPGFDNAVDRGVLSAYLRFNYVPEPYSIYRHVFKLEPGCVLTLSRQGTVSPPPSTPRAPMRGPGLELRRWWSLQEVAERGQANLLPDERSTLDTLEARLRDAIRFQSIADVPLGAFLSGGVDSSTIVALMQAEAMSPVRTFTIGFEDAAHDEALHARAVARHLGTDHTELYVTARDALDVIPRLPEIYDEPFADSSQIPTHLVCQQARRHVTVALSGDGGDELFGGYNRYVWARRVWGKLAWLPSALRVALARWILARPTRQWDALAARLRIGVTLPGDKAHKLAEGVAGVRDLDDLYVRLVSEWKQPEGVVLGASEVPTLLSQRGDWPALREAEHRMMALDALSYLPGDILCKVDRAAMSVSLETRVPFLDPGVVELAWRMPLAMKIRDGQGKRPLRRILRRYVPPELIERPKQGFAIPLPEWLRGQLRDWAEALLEEHRLRDEGFFDPAPIRRRWREHLEGRRNWQAALWGVLMFQAWVQERA